VSPWISSDRTILAPEGRQWLQVALAN
jgi:hypothetical protein